MTPEQFIAKIGTRGSDRAGGAVAPSDLCEVLSEQKPADADARGE
jgi:hypothetical protein